MPSTNRWEDTQGLPLFAHFQWLDRPAVVAKDHTWTWRDIHAASLALSQTLAAGQIICNLCTSHLACLIVWLASMRRGLPQILPASRGNLDLTSMLSVRLTSTLLISDELSGYVDRLPHVKIFNYEPKITYNTYSDDQLVWSPEADLPLITLYTSGSTGVPEAHHKSLGQLVKGARALVAGLNAELGSSANTPKDPTHNLLERMNWLVSSVPLQHMFGIEAALMLSVVYGNPVLDQRPLLPADIHSALDSCPKRSVWITTPLHLRALARSETYINNCSLVLASTMPLSTELATKTERYAAATVVEIYGSTETGALATRRTGISDEWRLLDDVDLVIESQRLSVVGEHFTSPQILTDSITPVSASRFKLHGRAKDLIKIAGRRTSVSSLNLMLQNLDGIEDGAFYLPTSIESEARLVLIYVSHTLSLKDIKRYLTKEIDPVFMPRSFIKVERIARNENGKLTDQILAKVHAEWLAGKKQEIRHFVFSVSSRHPSLAGHFPNRPIVPGVVILERVLAGILETADCCSSQFRQIKFSSELHPDELAEVRYEIKADKCVFEISATRENLIVTVASGTLMIDSKEAGHEMER